MDSETNPNNYKEHGYRLHVSYLCTIYVIAADVLFEINV